MNIFTESKTTTGNVQNIIINEDNTITLKFYDFKTCPKNDCWTKNLYIDEKSYFSSSHPI